MVIGESIRTSLEEVRAHPLRSFFTLIGVILGCLALVVVLSVMDGVEAAVWQGVEDLGMDGVLVINARKPTDRVEQAKALRKNPALLSEMLGVAETTTALLVIDQFEEAFTLCSNDDCTGLAAVIDALLQLCPDCRIILTLREEFANRLDMLERLRADERVRSKPDATMPGRQIEPGPGWFARRRRILPPADQVLAELPSGPVIDSDQSPADAGRHLPRLNVEAVS